MPHRSSSSQSRHTRSAVQGKIVRLRDDLTFQLMGFRGVEMIKTIWIQGHKSFNPAAQTPVHLAQNDKPTFIYGLNGAGKSAIAEVVAGLSRKDGTFPNCRIETTREDSYRYLVYNHEFVDRVVRESSMRGIFTVGEVDAERQAKIDELDADNGPLEDQITELSTKLEAAKQRTTAEEERAKKAVYKAHSFGRGTKLASLLVGYGNDARKFFRELRGYAPPEGAQLDSIERLEQRLADVSGSDVEKLSVSFDLDSLKAIEDDPIWATPVVVSSESRLSDLIVRLGNANWVADGQQYAHAGQCPFCQQVLPADFKAELAKLLEGERKSQVDWIDRQVSAYAEAIDTLHERAEAISGGEFAQGSGFALAWGGVHALLLKNLSVMRAKQRQPTEIVQITQADAEGISREVEAINAAIADFNARIRDRQGERSRIKAMFLQVLYTRQAQEYEKHDAQMALLQEAERELERELEQCRAQKRSNDDQLVALRRLQKGVDASIEAINSRLRSLGVEAFSVQRKEDDQRLYCLHRPGVPNCSTRTLSEGEKTLIAFLYFMESIKGSHDENESVDPSKTIVVIDDPISSLSQNYVYDIATIIVRELTRPGQRPRLAKQVIVLTHNLFFFHELIRQHARKHMGTAASRCGMLRIVKKQYSEVLDLDPTTLMNDYDSWWQILKDAQAGSVPVQVVPNAMRSILEQFFTFTTGGGGLPTGIAKLADEDTSEKYAALDRFINRGSHADGINGPPLDWTDYDVSYFLSKLRAMFRAVNYEDHFIRKMGLEEAAEAA